MALTQTQISELYVAIFNRASEGAGNIFWQAAETTTIAAQQMLESQDAITYFEGALDNDQAFIEHIYLNTFSKTVENDPDGIAYWVGLLTDGQSRGAVVAGIVEAATAPENAGDAQDQFSNRVAVSNYTAANVSAAPADYKNVLGFDSGLPVTADAATVTAAQQLIDAIEEPVVVDPGVEGATIRLTTDAEGDLLTGTENNDTFIARGNNSLTNADEIDGGAGIDTVEVMLDNGETAEDPKFTNIEILKVQAQSRTIDSGDNDVDNEFDGSANPFHGVSLLAPANVNAGDIEANIDAGHMESVEEYWSQDSRADLTIEDVSHNSHLTTIGMRETDPGDVDYNVFFDSQNVTRRGDLDGGSSLLVKVTNVYNLAEGENPFTGFDSVSFNVDGVEVVTSFEGISTYAELVSAIEASLALKNITNVIVAELPEEEAVFSIDVEPYSTGEQAGFYSPILLSSTTSQVTKGSFETNDETTDGNIVNSQKPAVAADVPALTSTMIILDRVGKNSEGGDLMIGSESSGNSGSAGIEQFYIDVDRDSHLTSISSTNNWLEVINVDNIAENNRDDQGALDFTGSLTVDSIWDVRVFDASTMQGNVTLGAVLTDAVVGKYLNQTDDDSNHTGDDSEIRNYRDVVDTEFSYDFGSGDDVLSLALNQTNLESAGTASREDFVLEINGGAGNDTISTVLSVDPVDPQTPYLLDTVGAGAGVDGQNWYENHVLNADLTINGDAGDDTINTFGSGNFIIHGGSGDDTIYTDNTGAKYIKVDEIEAEDPVTDSTAKWLVNSFSADGLTVAAADTNIYDLQGAAATTEYLLGFSTLTVTINAADGIASSDAGIAADNADAFAHGFEASLTIDPLKVTSLGINQAIKELINNDEVLSKVLVAEDGAGNTLVISSLVDGVFDVDDLEIVLDAVDYAELNQNQKTQLLNAAKEIAGDSTIADGAMQGILDAAVVNAHNEIFGLGIGAGDANGLDTAGAVFATDAGGAAIVGSANANVATDNTVYMGQNDDVIVLADAGQANETLVFEGNFGHDYVFNFTTDNADLNGSEDFLDFTSYLDNVISPSGSTVSQQRIATTLDLDANLTANEVSVFNTFAQTDAVTNTFANLTAAKLLAAIQDTAADDDYGVTLTDATFDVDAAPVDFVGTSLKSIIMIENDLNDGEYKVFETTASTTSNEFTAVTLVGTVDFGETINGAVALVDANFV